MKTRCQRIQPNDRILMNEIPEVVIAPDGLYDKQYTVILRNGESVALEQSVYDIESQDPDEDGVLMLASTIADPIGAQIRLSDLEPKMIVVYERSIRYSDDNQIIKSTEETTYYQIEGN